ncbi:hypothetical protein COW53_05070 [bacterium CG17_big_fil_post_rev_8_21_14_2_50_64_8]|nr:MAG: hypothetical protein COW53_05070 [bacterium CG17_big_fil_post_rev_8_21_14_2_50_64_8]
MPDFICIGGQRTGTTWLHHVLSANDAVWMPPCKELHHFDTMDPDTPAYPYRYREHLASRVRHYGLAALRAAGVRSVAPGQTPRLEWAWDRRYFLTPRRSIDWYRNLFEVASARGRVTGEITPAYSILPPARVAEIAAAFPALKVILILRDPIARAWSHALKDMPASAAQDRAQAVRFLRAPDCFERSNWPAILDRWSAAIPPERMLVLGFEQIRSDPQGFLNAVADFLGAPLTLPSEVGGSLRERGSSTFRAGGAPDTVVDAIADLYGPVIAETAARLPEVAAPWTRTWSRLLTA